MTTRRVLVDTGPLVALETLATSTVLASRNWPTSFRSSSTPAGPF